MTSNTKILLIIAAALTVSGFMFIPKLLSAPVDDQQGGGGGNNGSGNYTPPNPEPPNPQKHSIFVMIQRMLSDLKLQLTSQQLIEEFGQQGVDHIQSMINHHGDFAKSAATIIKMSRLLSDDEVVVLLSELKSYIQSLTYPEITQITQLQQLEAHNVPFSGVVIFDMVNKSTKIKSELPQASIDIVLNNLYI